MLYTVGFGSGATMPELRARLENYARATGGRAFFPQHARDLDSVFGQILTELASQYLLSYAPTNSNQDDTWRTIKVRVRTGKYDIRAREGYRATRPQRSGR